MMWKTLAFAAALSIAAGAAQAGGIGAELNGVRTRGQWGGEVGAGYRMSLSQFDITPAAGAFLYKDDGTRAKAYARVEAGLTIPAVARIGIGARYFRGDVRPYGTVSTALLPKLALKANAGPKYLAGGVAFGF